MTQRDRVDALLDRLSTEVAQCPSPDHRNRVMQQVAAIRTELVGGTGYPHVDELIDDALILRAATIMEYSGTRCEVTRDRSCQGAELWWVVRFGDVAPTWCQTSGEASCILTGIRVGLIHAGGWNLPS